MLVVYLKYKFKEKKKNKYDHQGNFKIKKKIKKLKKNLMKNEYFIEISCKIDKLMWVFCKSDGVKQKKQVFCVKQTESLEELMRLL